MARSILLPLPPLLNEAVGGSHQAQYWRSDRQTGPPRSAPPPPRPPGIPSSGSRERRLSTAPPGSIPSLLEGTPGAPSEGSEDAGGLFSTSRWRWRTRRSSPPAVGIARPAGPWSAARSLGWSGALPGCAGRRETAAPQDEADDPESNR